MSGLQSVPEKVMSKNRQVSLTLSYSGLCEDILVLKGDKELSLRRKDFVDGTAYLAFELPPGSHNLTVLYDGLLPGEIKEYPLTVVVDTTPPPIRARLKSSDGNQVTSEPTVTLIGFTEPDAKVKIEELTFVPGRDGKFEKEYELKPGLNHLLVWAQDPAGNRTEKTFDVYYDSQDPDVKWQFRPDAIFAKAAPELMVRATDDTDVPALSGVIDETEKLEWIRGEKGIWKAATPSLHDGYHTVRLKATDKSGRETVSYRQFVVNSSESLGETTLGLGARGADIMKLHERLALGGYLPLDASYHAQIFGQTTLEAIKKAQSSKGLEPTGLADPMTIAALGPRILINLREFALILERPGQEPLSWSIASGSPAHPTPTGSFVIAEKVLNPTWLPPKSDWAKDAEPIPPGPDNPLGTRWLGFDRGGVGIHGTNAPWSVGSASSHGCMRMVTPQVEKLFELVDIGTPVIVYSGYESDPTLSHYWPVDDVVAMR